MSSSTRNHKFQQSLEFYFDNSILFKFEENPIEWYSDFITINARNNKHEYRVHIPAQVLYYKVDAYVDIDGIHHNPEERYRMQKVPNMSLIKSDFTAFYRPYSLVENERKLSSVSMTNIKITPLEYTFIIQVAYYKSHIPYNIDMNSPNIGYLHYAVQNQHEKGEENNENYKMLYDHFVEVRQRADYIEQNMNIQHADFKQKEKNYLSQLERTRNIIIGLYKEKGVYEDCPVCLECINSDTFVATNCLHSICNKCYDKCVNCPICRDSYNKVITHTPYTAGAADTATIEDGEIWDEDDDDDDDEDDLFVNLG